MKYKLEIIENSGGVFTLIGYTWEGPYIWKVDIGPITFTSMDEVAKFLIRGYK